VQAAAEQPAPSATPLVSPTPQPDGQVIYNVVEGDTLIAIADRFSVNIVDLYLLNGLNQNSILSIGQPLLLGHGGRPDGSTALPGFPRARLLPNGETIHTIAAGETLGAIAFLYDVTIEELVTLNEGLQADGFLQINQEIVVDRRPQAIATGASADAPTSEATAVPSPIPTLVPLPPTPTIVAYPIQQLATQSAELAAALPTTTATAVTTLADLAPAATGTAITNANGPIQQASTGRTAAVDAESEESVPLRLWLPILLATVGMLAMVGAIWLYRGRL
jgi:LysM repeat protein